MSAPESPKLTPLRRRVPDRFAADAARIVRVCNERGYAVTPVDGCAAYRAWSESKGIAWLPMAKINDQQVFDAVMESLEGAPMTTFTPVVSPPSFSSSTPPPLPPKEEAKATTPARPASPLGGHRDHSRDRSPRR